MATDTQLTLFKAWAVDTDFTYNDGLSPKANFGLLAKAHGWYGGDENWVKHWEQCFGETYQFRVRDVPLLPSASTSPRSSISAGSASPSPVATPTSPPFEPGYWGRFEGFEPRVDADFVTQFNALALHQGWSKKQRRAQRAEAIQTEFDHLYGTDASKLQQWQDLCREVGIEEVPNSITKCKKALGGVYVNLVNLIDHRRNGVPIIRFASFRAFRKYTLAGRIFPKKRAKQDGFIRALLRKVR